MIECLERFVAKKETKGLVFVSLAISFGFIDLSETYVKHGIETILRRSTLPGSRCLRFCDTVGGD